MTPAEKLAAARRIEADKDRAWRNHLADQEAAALALMDRVESEVMPKLRPARTEEYVVWLRGHLEHGGNVTHVYDYPFRRSEFRMALDNVTLPPGLCGAMSLQIIVPRGLTVEYTDLGHCTLYVMDGFRLVGNWVPAYSDIDLD